MRASYSVSLARSARKEIERLPDDLVRRIFPKLESLEVDPRPTGVKKLAGEANIWRLRVGDYRILYTIDEARHEVLVAAVLHRSQVYRSKD